MTFEEMNFLSDHEIEMTIAKLQFQINELKWVKKERNRKMIKVYNPRTKTFDYIPKTPYKY